MKFMDGASGGGRDEARPGIYDMVYVGERRGLGRGGWPFVYSPPPGSAFSTRENEHM